MYLLELYKKNEPHGDRMITFWNDDASFLIHSYEYEYEDFCIHVFSSKI